MNKYQRAILENQDTKVFYTCSSVKNHAPIVADFDYDTDTYKLIQEEDIFSTQYEFTVQANSNIESCEFCINGEWHTAERKEGNFLLVSDFNSRTEKIKLSFADNIADDYIFSVQYIEADKDLYYQKQAESTRNAYIEAAQIKHSTGTDLVNIYFQPCCTECGKTEIELWIAKGKRENHHGMIAYVPRFIGGEPEQMIAKFSIEEGFLFKSISGLANGVYAYRVIQYSKSEELLFESDFQIFEIRSQGAGRPMGHINRI
ncbi:MAG: hypothetical protein IJX58_06960 [Clostridia bacterium]|nr:hypothetical protein [Clostridia bacterium]